MLFVASSFFHFDFCHLFYHFCAPLIAIHSTVKVFVVVAAAGIVAVCDFLWLRCPLSHWPPGCWCLVYCKVYSMVLPALKRDHFYQLVVSNRRISTTILSEMHDLFRFQCNGENAPESLLVFVVVVVVVFP